MDRFSDLGYELPSKQKMVTPSVSSVRPLLRVRDRQDRREFTQLAAGRCGRAQALLQGVQIYTRTGFTPAKFDELPAMLREWIESAPWAPFDEVLDQSPPEGTPVAKGQAVNLVLANSVYTFQATRTLKDEMTDKTEHIKTRYRVKRRRDNPIGEFELQEVQLSSAGELVEFLPIVSQVKGTSGEVAVGA